MPPVPVAATRYRMVFPLAGPWAVLSVFGADRDGGERSHQGVDMAAPKLTPVLAVRDGVISHLSPTGVAVAIAHDDGWTSWYVHLNNDTLGTDDGLGRGIAPGLEVGSRVIAGQVIGWVGDSGNAETTPAHLHFELRTPWGEAIDPLVSLQRSWWVAEEVPFSFTGAFWDDDDHWIAPTADLMVSLGLLTGCGPSGLGLCPDELLTGNDLTVLLWGALGLEVEPAAYLPYRWDPLESMIFFRPGLTLEQAVGCGVWLYCPDLPMRRGEVAAVLAGVLQLEPIPVADYYSDIDGHFAAGAINALVAAGIFDVCTDLGPLPYEPDGPITRAETISMIARALELTPAVACKMVA